MPRRRLSPEERALWDLVAGQTKRLAPAPSRPLPAAKPPRPSAPLAMPEPPKPPLTHFRLGEKAAAPPRPAKMPALTEHLRAAPPAIDAKAHRSLTRGKLKPDARIDLHGLTVAEAHPMLTGFILTAHRQGKRLILVITGKGKGRGEPAPMPVRQGVLRHQVPHWLSLPPLRPLVLQITPAHIRHGGEGAYYVYLRKRG